MARSFDGSSTYLSVGDDAILSLPDGSWTLAGWININPVAGFSIQYFLSHGEVGSRSSCNLLVTEPTASINLTVVSDDGTAKTVGYEEGRITAGVWHHIALRCGGEDLRAYIDGTQSGSNNATTWDGVNPSGSLYLGIKNDLNSSFAFGGRMAEWAKWDVALSDEQLAALVAGVRPTEIGTRPAWYLPMFAGLEEEVAALAVTNNGSTVAEHPPATVLPGCPHVLRTIPPGIGGPYQVVASETHLAGAAGDAFFTGSTIGQINGY